MLFLRALGYLCYLMVVAGLVLSAKPAFAGRWGLELSAILVFLSGLLLWPFLSWLRLTTSDDPLTLPGGRRVRLGPGQRVAIAVLGLVLLVGPCEVAFRVNRRNQKRTIAALHPFLQNQNLPGRLHVNSHGFRGEEIQKEKPDGAFRIFVMGGSTVFCERVPFEKSHVRLLEKKLRGKHPGRRFEVLNAGVPWYTTQHSMIHYLFKIRDFEPDLVICYHAINDLYRSFSPYRLAFGAYRSDYSHYFGSVARLVFSYFRGDSDRGPGTGIELLDHIVSAFADRFIGSSAEEIEVPSFGSLAAFRRNMRAFAERLRLDGVPLVLCTQPNLYRSDLTEEERAMIVFPGLFCREQGKIPNLESMIRAMEGFNGATKDVARRFRVPLLDLESELPKTGDYFIDDCHYTEAGNRAVAEAIFRFLEEKGLLD